MSATMLPGCAVWYCQVRPVSALRWMLNSKM